MKFLEKYWWVIVALVALWWYANYRWQDSLFSSTSTAVDAGGGSQDSGS